MASYGPIYEFAFDSQNGADILIVISKKNYTGEVTRRPLGRAPILKRENNENIYGTSLEIYAECKVDGEYAEFYTSSADEFKVDVYKDQVLIWTGFITPELYSEPDIAPPYDVQIIATDGLGELRDLTFYSNETKSVYEHIKSMLDAMNATRLYGIISDLKYVSGDFVSGAAGLFDMRVNLEHEVGNNCYDVLQNILRSINASMTLYGDSWLIFRKTDFIRLAEEDWVHGAYSNGHETLYPVAEFGSMDKTNWWPIGQMSSAIEPAKKSIVFQAPNHYKRNVLSDAWVVNNSASYDNVQKAYTLPSKDSYITQHIDFGAEIGYALSLKIKAMNVGAPIFDTKKGNYIDQGIGIRVKVVDEGHPIYLESLDSDRGIGSYHWVSDESTWIEGDLALPALSDRKSDAQEVEIIIPLYVFTPMSSVIASSIDVTVFNIDGTYPINIYDISLGAHEKAPGYKANVVLNNNAREEGDSVETTFSDAYRLANAGYIFMSGIPMLPYQDVAIGSWQIDDGEVRDYVTTMAEDYAMQSALPRMSYRGVLNVPRANLPVLFLRDGTYYFPRTYSYNLYDDELEVELISVPAADVEVSSIVVSEYTPSYGASSGSSGGSGSGGGSGIGGGIDLSGYAKKEEVTTLSELLASMWTIDEETGDLVTDRNVRIAKNVIIGGDMSSAAKGRDAGAAGGIIGVKVGDAEYTDITDGILDMTDAFKDLDVDLSDYYTSDETDAKIAESLIPYAKIADVGSTYATKASLETLQGEVNNIEAILGIDEEAEGIINTWNEVKAFLDGYSSSDDLAAILSTMNADIAKRALGSDLIALTTRVKAEEDITATYKSWWADLKSLIVKDGTNNIKIKGNLIVAGDTSTGGTGSNPEVAGTLIGIKVNGTIYDNSVNGILTIPDYPTSLEWSAINGKPTKLTEFTNDAGFITSAALNGYATQSWVEGKNYLTSHQSIYGLTINNSAGASQVHFNPAQEAKTLTLTKAMVGLGNVDNKSSATIRGEITSANVTNALGYTPLSTAGGTITGAYSPLAIQRQGDAVGVAIEYKSTVRSFGYIGAGIRDGVTFPFFDNGTTYTLYHTGNFNPADYLPKSGGTISGGTNDYTPLIIKNTSLSEVWIAFQDRVGTTLIGSSNGVPSVFLGSGSNQTLIHSGNIGNQKVAGLVTARTIWGQSFDGTGNVSGDISLFPSSQGDNKDSAKIRFRTLDGRETSPYIQGVYTSEGYSKQRLSFFQTNASSYTPSYFEAMTILPNGNVGINTPDPQYKLDVAGTARCGKDEDGADLLVFNMGREWRFQQSGVGGSAALVLRTLQNGKYFHLRNNANETAFTYVAQNSANRLYAHCPTEIDSTLNVNGAVTMSSTLSVSKLTKLGNTTRYALEITTSTSSHIISFNGVDNNESAQIGYGSIGLYGFNYATYRNNASIHVTGFGISDDGIFYISPTGNPTTSNAYFKVASGGDVTIAKNLIVGGDTSTGSDIRFKDKITDHRIALSDIANAPLFTFKWNDREDKTEHLGSSAQYWEKVAPWLVKGEDFKTLDYSTLGVAIGISLANKTLNHEERIKMLEKENKALKEQIRRIQHGS